MTTSERIALTKQLLDQQVAHLRTVVRRNGAPIGPDAGVSQVAEHALKVDLEQVRKRLLDINTIDTVKRTLQDPAGLINRPALTTEELLEYGINDERLTAEHKSWAVVRITKSGAQILTCGGDYYQKYKATVTTEEVVDEASGEATTVTTETLTQEGDVDLLRSKLEAQEAAWMAEEWAAALDETLPRYEEAGITYYQVPCDLPGSLEQLLCIHLERSAVDGSGRCSTLSYGLTGNSCDDSNQGMLGLPHNIWLIYDNSDLQAAPRALLIPAALADGTQTGIRIDKVRIAYNAEVSGLARLRLVSDVFGEEYIVSTQDWKQLYEGTWNE